MRDNFRCYLRLQEQANLRAYRLTLRAASNPVILLDLRLRRGSPNW
jgi:hypothetical protein